jgi:hypothetical protein
VKTQKALFLRRDCGCVYERESGTRVHRCAGHQVENLRITPTLQRARRLTPTHPAAGDHPQIEVRSMRGRDWEAIAWRLAVIAGVILFWTWVGMRCAR